MASRAEDAAIAVSDREIALHGTREQAAQRLKVGLAGLFAMVLLVGFASTVIQQTRTTADPAEAVTASGEPAPPAKDPLVDMGVVPELPVEDVVVPDLPEDQMVPADDPLSDPVDTGAPPAG